MRSFFGEVQNGPHIASFVSFFLISIQTVQGEVHLPQGRFTEKHLLVLRKQGAVGGEIYLDLILHAEIQKLFKCWMKEGLSFHVEIDIVGIGSDFLKPSFKFFYRQEAFGALYLWAEAAGEIAGAGDFHINLFIFRHDGSPSITFHHLN